MSNRFLVSLISIFAVFVNLVAPTIIHAQLTPDLPDPGTMIEFSESYQPAVITGIIVNSDDPLMFDFIIDRGESGLTDAELEVETQRLVKFFLAALTIPDEEVWVNLSPYEKDLMIPSALGITEMGKDMLEQDYLLKQITASLTHPESDIGKKFWKKVYDKAYKLYGTTEIPINTFSKVWIVPERASVLEKEGVAFVVENRLKVMLEEDYLAIEKNLDNKEIGTDLLSKERVEYINNISSEIVNEVILPELTTEINEGENFAVVRQIFNSIILATWYKDRIKETILGQVYVDQNKIAGVDVSDKEIKEKIYAHYMDALKTGVYNLTRADFDAGSKATIERKYFSGGMDFFNKENRVNKSSSPVRLGPVARNNYAQISSAIRTNAKDSRGLDRFSVVRVRALTTNRAVVDQGPRVILAQSSPIEIATINNREVAVNTSQMSAGQAR
ncbi:MAG: hypothetical protein KAJ18_07285, partial [Candidatus Omnitrophica bacterium]|nr:hypothetical protein [Candidatus Omnitrophota bacterium]